MRRRPLDSPRDAARTVAPTVVADGDIGDAEVEWLDRGVVHARLSVWVRGLSAGLSAVPIECP